MKRILMIDDNEAYHFILRKLLQKYDFEIVSAHALDEAQDILDHSPPFDLVIVADCVGSNKFNSGPFIERLRRRFGGPIVAAALDPNIRERMFERGCDFGNENGKIAGLVINILI